MNHRLLYQEQIRLPLIVRTPNGPRGKRVGELVRNVDVYPTVMESLGFELKKNADGQPLIDGRSLLGLMRGEPEPPRYAYADQLNRWDANAFMVHRRPDDAQIHCMMDRTWKLIYRLTAPDKSLLYNLAADPREQNDLYRPDHPEARRLQALLDAVGNAGAYVRTPFKEGASNRATAILQQMGYIGDEPTAHASTQPTSGPTAQTTTPPTP
jgi:arylsulfatase A-like enzyme